MTRLDDLRGAFLATDDGLGHPITTHQGDVEAELIIDGDRYFTEVFDALEPPPGSGRTRPDVVLIVGWTFMTNLTKGTHRQLGDILANLQLAGAKVHVVLNGSLYQNAGFLPYGQCLAALKDLRDTRGATPPGPGPLDQSVLFDFSGAPVTGSHHQKVIVVQTGGDVVAYVGGIDFHPDRDDGPAHDGSRLRLGGQPWGWHDLAIRLRGTPVADAWANFVSRYNETLGLPVKRAFWRRPSGPPSRMSPYNPSPGAPLPPTPTVLTPVTPNPDIALQVLRSRYPLKMPRERPPLVWTGPPTGGIRQVHATLHKALGAAQRFIYIEDQFLADTFDGDDFANGRTVSLFPDLVAAARRGVKIIMLTSGKVDFPAPPTAPPRTVQNQLIDLLTTGEKANVCVWKLTDLMVHSKLIIIDDVFCAVGSANIHSRSMWGVDQELHVALVDAKVDSNTRPAGVIRDWRVKLWLEHLDYVAPAPPPYLSAMESLDTGLGMWRKGWLIGGSPNMWFQSNNPPGFAPARNRRTFVGPPPTEP